MFKGVFPQNTNMIFCVFVCSYASILIYPIFLQQAIMCFRHQHQYHHMKYEPEFFLEATTADNKIRLFWIMSSEARWGYVQQWIESTESWCGYVEHHGEWLSWRWPFVRAIEGMWVRGEYNINCEDTLNSKETCLQIKGHGFNVSMPFMSWFMLSMLFSIFSSYNIWIVSTLA